jgi:hypothetical protein
MRFSFVGVLWPIQVHLISALFHTSPKRIKERTPTRTKRRRSVISVYIDDDVDQRSEVNAKALLRRMQPSSHPPNNSKGSNERDRKREREGEGE